MFDLRLKNLRKGQRPSRSLRLFSQSRGSVGATRKAISLIEVLISMFVLLFGLMGVAAIFPVGNHYVMQGENSDLGSSIAQNAFEELRARGMLQPQHWQYCDSQFNLASETTSDHNPPVEYDFSVFQPATLDGGVNPNHGKFNIQSAIGPGYAFVLDPLGAATDPTLPNLDVFPRIEANPINVWERPPAGLSLPGTRWPVRRITVLDANGLMNKVVAETIFRLRDDLAVEQPDESDVPSIQRWDTVDLGGTPNDPTDDALLRRQYQGNFSWLATIVPVTNRGLQALQPSSSDYGQVSYDVSVVVFRKRDETPSSESERMIQAELLPGGEVVFYSQNGTFAKDEVDAALDDVRPGNWIALMGVNQTTGDFMLKWYRILSMGYDDETEEITLPRAGVVIGRRATLFGPDWPPTRNPRELDEFLPSVADLRAAILPGAISVVTKPLRMEDYSLWKMQ